MSSEFYTLGIDIGGTHFRMGLVGKEGQVLTYEKHPTAVLMGEDPAALLGDAISEYCLRHGARDHVVAACIGLPATVDKARERVLNAPNVRGFDGVPLGRILRKRLGVPVLIERDVNVQLLADMRRLDIQSGDVLACYVGTGIGNAILLGGALLTGHHGVAGELGHIPFGDSQQPCGCGNTGCAEGLAGGLYLAALARDIFCRTPIEELFVRHGKAIHRALGAGDRHRDQHPGSRGVAFGGRSDRNGRLPKGHAGEEHSCPYQKAVTARWLADPVFCGKRR